MDVMTPLLNALQAQANISDTKSQTALRMQEIQKSQVAMQNQQAITELMRSRASQLTANGKPDAPDMIANDDGTVTSADASNPLLQTLNSAKRNVARATEDAEMAYFTEDFKSKLTADKQLSDEQKEYRLAQKAVLDDMKDRYKQSAQTIAGAETPQDLQSAIEYISDSVSPKAANEAAQQIIKALPDWKTATPAQIRAAVAPIANRYATQGDQLRAKSAEQAAKDRAASLEERKVHDRALEQSSTASNALRREGINLSREKFEASKGVRDDKEIRKTEDKAQNDLSKDKVVDSFWKIDKGYKAAKNVTDNLAKTGFRSITPAEGETLLTEYTQAVNNYRSLVGGKWNDQKRKNFDSVFDKVSASLQSIGKGKIPSEETMRTVAAEMERMHADANVEVVKKTLQQRDKVWRRQGDPSIITSPGSIDKALKTPGVDMVVDKESGDKIMRFGPDKEDWFVIHDKPKKQPRYDPDDEDD